MSSLNNGSILKRLAGNGTPGSLGTGQRGEGRKIQSPETRDHTIKNDRSTVNRAYCLGRVCSRVWGRGDGERMKPEVNQKRPGERVSESLSP